jgi:glycosyltransferase involved in cell wall biosynthesis
MASNRDPARACGLLRILLLRSILLITPIHRLPTLLNRDDFLPGSGTPGLVSVIIPCYNRAHIVRETIDSVLAQTYRNLEALVIDDGSTDDTREVVSSYPDPRIRYFHRENGGLSAARNSGLNNARGEFVAFLDSDDTWHPWKLAAQIEIFRRHPEAGLIWSDMSTFTSIGEILSLRHLRTYYAVYESVNFERTHRRAGTLTELVSDAPPDLAECPYYVADVFKEMFGGNLVHPSTAIVRRERLQKSGPFEPEVTGPGAEDYHFYFRVTAHGPVAFLDAPTTLFRLHESQMTTSNRLHEARGNLTVVLHWLQRHPSVLPHSRIRERLAGSHAWLGAEELYAGNSRGAIRHLWRSFRLHSRRRTALMLMISLLPQKVAHILRRWKQAVRGAVKQRIIGIAIVATNCQDTLWVLIGILQPELGAV